MKDSRITTDIKAAVTAVDPDADVVLYGSRARRENRADSDWDLLVLPQQKIISKLEDDFRAAIYDLELKYEEVFSVFFFPKLSWLQGASPSPLHDNIRQEGVLI